MATQTSPTPPIVEPDKWLTPKQTQAEFNFGHTTFWKLASEKAFPVYRPVPPSGKKTRIVLIKKSDVQRFIESGCSQ